MKKNILVLGGSGLLGNSFLKFSSDQKILTNVFRQKPFFPSTNIKLDLFNIEDIKTFIKEHDINIILNFAALADVERCSADPDYAYSLNAIIPKNLALASKDTNSYLVHISTDHLYGDDNIFHEENDKVLLLNNYAETKYQGEEYIKFNCTQFLILRTNFFCQGYSKDSFADWIVKSIKSKEYIDLFDDVYFNPVHSQKIFEIIDLFYQKNVLGLFNIASNERISKFEFGISLASSLGLDSCYIRRSSISNSSQLHTRRPKNMTLSNKKLNSLIDLELSLSSSIDSYVNEIATKVL